MLASPLWAYLVGGRFIPAETSAYRGARGGPGPIVLNGTHAGSASHRARARRWSGAVFGPIQGLVHTLRDGLAKQLGGEQHPEPGAGGDGAAGAAREPTVAGALRPQRASQR